MEMTVPAAVAATVAVYDEKNAELNYTIQVAFSETTPKAWGHYAVTFAAHVEKIGGYMLVMPKILNDFAYKCPWGASEVRTTLFARVSREYDEKLFGDKEVLVQNDRRVAAFISLTSMLAPSETEAVVKKVETAYAVAGLEVPKVVTKKVAERRKVFAELTARREERELEEIRKPFLRREWSAREKCDYLVSRGYRMELHGRDLRGNTHFSRADPVTGAILKQTVYREYVEQYGSLRMSKPKTAAERAKMESERDARRAKRISAQPVKGKGGSADPHGKGKKGDKNKKRH